MALFHCPVCQLPLTDAEASLTNCTACGGSLVPSAEAQPAQPMAGAPSENRMGRRPFFQGMAVGAGAVAVLVMLLLMWYWKSGRQVDIAETKPAPATVPTANQKPDATPVATVPGPDAVGEKARVVYPLFAAARAKTLGEGLTDEDFAARAKPGPVPAEAPPAPKVADERPAPPQFPPNNLEPFGGLQGLPDKNIGGLLAMQGGPANQLEQIFKLAAERNQELEKLFNMAGMQDLDLQGALKGFQGFGKAGLLQGVQGFPGLPGVRPPGLKIEDPAPARSDDVDEVSLTGDGIGDKDLLPLRGLTKLRVVTVSRTAITDAGLAHLAGLKGLRQLYLTGTAVTDRGLEHLHGLTELRVLDLAKTRVTDAGVKRLQQVLPEVKITR